MNQLCIDDDTGAEWVIYTWSSGGDALGQNVLTAVLPITNRTQALEVHLRCGGYSDTAVSDVTIFGRASDLDMPLSMETGSSLNVTVADPAVETEYSFDVYVPETAAQRGCCLLRLNVCGAVDVHTPKAAPTVSDSGADWAIFPSIPVTYPSVIYCTTDNTIEPRRLMRVETSGGNDKIWVLPAWNKIPIPGTDALDFYTMQELHVWQIAIWEKSVSDFFDYDPSTLGG
jgi:hypothetical protein